MQLRLLFLAGTAIDVFATLLLWAYIMSQGISAVLLYALAAAWVFAILMMAFLLAMLVAQRQGYGGLSGTSQN